MKKSTAQKKVAVVTLGCAKNTVDSERLLRQLDADRFRRVEDAEKSDIIIINTCGFIGDAQQESIDAIVQAAELKKMGKIEKLVVMGCMVERFRKTLKKEIPEVDAFIGANKLPRVLKALDADFHKDLLGERRLLTPSHYGYLKISEGCDHPCSFCAIPLMRGKNRSQPMKSLVKEAAFLARNGVKELIVIAQDTTAYGLDRYGKRQLAPLLRSLAQLEGIEWIRLMYTYPAKFSIDVLNVYQETDKMCRSIDIPIQHISDRVLRSMHRGVSEKTTRSLLEKITSTVPGIALRTTLIVGYPGETEEDFQRLLEFVKELRFHRLGVFTYSPEEGTDAYRLGDQIPAEVKQERFDAIMELQSGIAEERNKSLIGARLKVIIDVKDSPFFIGRTEWDAPEIDQEVLVAAESKPHVGDFSLVTIVDHYDYDLVAK